MAWSRQRAKADKDSPSKLQAPGSVTNDHIDDVKGSLRKGGRRLFEAINCPLVSCFMAPLGALEDQSILFKLSRLSYLFTRDH